MLDFLRYISLKLSLTNFNNFDSGYMSPEYAMEGTFSIKSDAYSFGVLILEIVTGKKNSSHYDDISSTLVGHVSMNNELIKLLVQ